MKLTEIGLTTEEYEKIMTLIKMFKAQKVTVSEIKLDKVEKGGIL